MQNSGFLNLLDPGDVVLADRGVAISDDLRIYGTRLEISAFKRGKKAAKTSRSTWCRVL